jgi:hypothetical protein
MGRQRNSENTTFYAHPIVSSGGKKLKDLDPKRQKDSGKLRIILKEFLMSLFGHPTLRSGVFLLPEECYK